MPLSPFSGILDVKRAAHLLRRATFGASKSEIDSFVGLSVSQAVGLLIRTDIPDPILPIDPATGTDWIQTPITGANSSDNDLQEFFKRWLIGNMLGRTVAQQDKLAFTAREKATFFLHTYFTTKQSKVNDSRALYYQNQLFRLFTLDKDDPLKDFKALTKKMAVDNAMLEFLDGNTNVAGNPNENYGREMFELYTIGRGLEGTLPPITDPGDYFNFTEEDVQAAARVLSGFQVDDSFSNLDPDTMLPRGVVRGGATASAHDNDPKQFSDRFANQIIQPDPLLLLGGNATEESALDEINQMTEMIFAQEETVRHLCRKLYRYYVYYEITQDIEDNIITEMTNSFITNGYKLQPLLEELFQSQHFYDAAAGADDDNFGGIIKSPLDLVLGTVSFFEMPVPDYETDTANFYDVTGNLLRQMSDLGMDFYEPFEVAGYAAYHQFPIYNRNWISTNYLTSRYDFIRQTMSAMNMMEPGEIGVDLLAFTQANFDNAIAQDARLLIMELAKYLLPVSDNLTFDTAADDNAEITAERLNYFLVAFLFSPQIDPDPEGSWTFRWNNPVDTEVVTRQLESLMNGMLQTPEYQLF